MKKEKLNYSEEGQINFTIEIEKKEKLKIKAIKEKKSMKQILIELIDKYIEEGNK